MTGYFTKVLGRTVSPAEAWAKATPGQWRDWFPDGPPAGPSGPAWNEGPPAADLARAMAAGKAAMAAGKAAMAAGYGLPTRADGLIPCGHCTPCDGGRPDRCHQPQGKAEARLRAQQAEGDRLDEAEAASVELQRVVFAEEERRRLAF
jgi:hypothetical protein